MSDTVSNWTKVRTRLERNRALIAEGLDTGKSTTYPLLAGLTLALSWMDELEPAGEWDKLEKRLVNAVAYLADSQDAGEVTNFGMWDGLKFALSVVKGEL